ncbi:ATP-grasp domain-containing protein [Actinomycetospora aeridis]|uniref:ATP-grasp domain-containing protein n=1 Tax=Actinomycetospora aeridis TaxID=3129231 RepID=A0ABU8MYJ3_9PSEU
MRIALATCREVPGLLDDEGRLLEDRLRARGVEAEPAVWDDADVAWSAFDLVLVRSTWDYPTRHREFLAWADAVERVSALHNPASVLAWTTDKHYLLELAGTGLPVVPSAVLEPGSDDTDPAAHPYVGVEHVVKPCVSAGSKDTLRCGPGESGRSAAHVRALLDAGRPVLVQPYLAAVDEVGETAVVAIDGAPSHAVRKGALLASGGGLVEGLFAPEDISAREPSPAETAVAAHVLEHLATPMLYARIDLLPGPEGPQVLEVELAEPSLFLEHAPGAADRLADAVVRRLR